ncbi:MAG: electron transfer flavoprotein subunit beta/FixA family protein [Spirochaetota bacterium]|nr:electron transfer flavoprotein subunit beta/FixA family protein [Spirochaetota bacterium]
MKIVVCVKQVPGTTEVSIDPETKRLIREGVSIEMNPFDTYALEQGILLREEHGGEVIVLSMGPKRAELTLRESIACGADSGILLNGRPLGGSDTYATSYILSQAIKKIGNVDLVICGKQAVDGDTAQVGPGIAAHLEWPQVTYVSRFVESGPFELKLERMHETGSDISLVKLPSVLTVLKDVNIPRIPTLKGRLNSRKVNITIWDENDLNTDPDKIGLGGSPTRVVSTRKPDARDKHTIVLNGSASDSAKELVKILKSHIEF